MFFPSSRSGGSHELPGHGSLLSFLLLLLLLVQCWLGKYIVQLYSHAHTIILTHMGVRGLTCCLLDHCVISQDVQGDPQARS